MKHSFSYLIGLCILITPMLFSCNATTKEVADLNRQRDVLDSTIQKQESISNVLSDAIQEQGRKKAELFQKVSLLEAKAAGKKIAYILSIEISIRKGLEMETTDASFEIPVSEDFYNKAVVGEDVANVDASKTLSLSFLNAESKVKGKRTAVLN